MKAKVAYGISFYITREIFNRAKTASRKWRGGAAISASGLASKRISGAHRSAHNK